MIVLSNIDEEIILENPMTGEQATVNPKVAGANYAKYAREQAKFVENMFNRSEADHLDLITNKAFAVPLATFLKERIEKGK